MNTAPSWITPFWKQCYVTVGVSLNMLGHGTVAGFTAILFPQLRAPGSSIKIDQASESWIASVIGITFILGNLIGSVAMDKWGRKKAKLCSIAIMAGGWYATVWSSSVASLIASRAIQGLSLGMSIHLSPAMIGEYTSPRYRGVFLATINFAITCGILTTHILGSFIRWQTTALVCGIIPTFDFLVVSLSPETPIWLLGKGRYEECKTVFRCLRGLNDEEELTKMIKDNITAQSKKKTKNEHPLRRFLNKLSYLKVTVVKEEFYKPSLIVIHLYILSQWGGMSILSQFTSDVFTHVVGGNIDASMMTTILAVHRFVSGIYMTFILDKFKRRTMVISSGLVTVISLLSIAGFAYARNRNLLSFDYSVIGIVLIHLQMVSASSSCLALAFILAGELFPLEYKGIAGGLSATSVSLNLFILAQTAPYLFLDIGIHGAYCIYAAVTVYSIVMILIFLPETKGRTLQEIEDFFRKTQPVEEAETSIPLTDR